MAIDTAAKRRSVSGILTGIVSVGVTPGITNAAWRQDVGWGYRGIPVNPAPPVAAVLIDRFTLGDAGTWGTPPGTLGGTW